MPTPPPTSGELAGRGVRGLAVGAVLLVVAAVTALAEGDDGLRPAVLATGAALLLTAGAVRAAAGRWRSASATSAVLAGVVLATLAARSWLGIDDTRLALFLAGAGAVAVATGLASDERRLTAFGIGQWALAAALPPPDAALFRHCLVATDLALPVPRLDGPILVGIGALAAGTALRWTGRRRRAGRGIEMAGLLVLLGALLAKGIELPGLPLLCGSGDTVDVGWLGLALLVGLATTAYGLATTDAGWAAAGPTTVVLGGLAGTTLGGGAGWALLALAPVVGALGWYEWQGMPWPSDPGYGRRAPWSEAPGPSRHG